MILELKRIADRAAKELMDLTCRFGDDSPLVHCARNNYSRALQDICNFARVQKILEAEGLSQ